MGETKELSLERRRFLQEMGAVVVDAFGGFSVDADGVVEGSSGRWTPLEDQAPLDTLFKTMRLAGLDAAGFKFQQYDVVAANPYHGGKVDLKFASQMVIKGDHYTGIHQVDLVLRSPFVTATEIQTGIRLHSAE